MKFLDVGANYGLFSLAALRYGGPEARVVAVDPSKTSNRILRKNLKLAGASARVQIIQAAVGEGDGTLSMLTTGPSGDHYLIAAPADRADGRKVRQYSVTSIIDLTAIEPTHIKIDVEGFEHQAIIGALPYLKRARPILFLELHGDMLRNRGRDPAVILAQITQCGYRRIERNGQPIEPKVAAALPITRLVCLPD